MDKGLSRQFQYRDVRLFNRIIFMGETQKKAQTVSIFRNIA